MQSPSALARLARGVQEIPGFAPMELAARPDAFMVELLEEEIGHTFSPKVEFLLWAGSERLCFPRAHFLQQRVNVVWGVGQCGSESPPGRGHGDRPGARPGLCRLREPPGGGYKCGARGGVGGWAVGGVGGWAAKPTEREGSTCVPKRLLLLCLKRSQIFKFYNEIS